MQLYKLVLRYNTGPPQKSEKNAKPSKHCTSIASHIFVAFNVKVLKAKNKSQPQEPVNTLPVVFLC